MKRLASAAAVALLLYSCQKSIDKPVEEKPGQPALMARADLDTRIKNAVISTGRYDWSMATDEMIWSALQNSDNILSVGFKISGESNDLSQKIHNINIKTGAWAQAKQELLEMILQEEQQLNPSLRTIADIEAYPEDILPVVDVVVKNINTIRLLRNSGLTRYVEPLGYQPAGFYEADPAAGRTASSSGCGSNVAEGGLINGTDYTVIAPNAWQSWNFAYHNIAQAWSKSTGSGVKIMIIDSGISPAQSLFTTYFNSGSSSGRSFEKTVTLRKPGFLGFGYGGVETSTDDGCGHGTSMAGAAAAPRTSLSSATGVAYNSNLFCVRAATDVFLDESRENKGVADAFTLAGNRADVKIVSMSMGSIISSGQVSDAVDYAYNKGKLIFCAGGTSFGWSAGWYGVIFPAWKSNVNAVTGVKDNFSRCNSCHDGSEIDFTLVMEKAANERHQLSTAQSGFAPSTVGGSSVSTASTAGIAALVWSKYPSWTREQVVNRLIQSSSNYPTRSGSLGWGRINADLATN